MVTTNLDGFSGEMTNRNFTLLVRARTDEGEIIYSDNIVVTLDGEPVTAPTGSDVYEYQLYFEDPVQGDTEIHVITVLAWDDRGNSTFLRYEVTYSFVDTGGVVGTAYILLDATTVGLDPDTLGGAYAYQIKQNEPASYAVLAMLEEFGYEVQYARTPDDGFYLQRISRGGMMDYGKIPENLWAKILADEIGLTGQSSANSLGEFDYTQGSGWMYSVNGVLYAGKSLSDYYLSDGDTLYLRFTLAYGKDIGGYNSSGGSYGKLPTYCGKWINGTYLDEHRWGEETVLLEPTCTQAGTMAQTCSVCGDVRNEVPLEPLGHDLAQVTRQEPTCTEPGSETGVCSRCGETVQTVLEALGHDLTETDRREPTCTEAGYVISSCSRCHESIQSDLEALGHDLTETDRREPTCTEAGYVISSCSRCHESVRSDLEALGHDWRETDRREPTCTEAGYVISSCSRCDETAQTALEPLGHNFVETGRQEPAEGQEGWVDYACSRCGETKRETLPPTGSPVNMQGFRRKKRETKSP